MPPPSSLAVARLTHDPDATADELTEVFAELAKRFHPDWRTFRTDGERSNTADTFRLWEAYRLIADPTINHGLRPLLERRVEGGSRPLQRLPLENECMWCGSTPTRQIRFRAQRAAIWDRDTVTADGVACRSCGLSVGARLQRLTGRAGWWSPRSLVTNGFVLNHNRKQLQLLRRMDPPRYRDQNIVSLLRAPLENHPW